MQTPSDPLPPWLIPHMNTPFRFIDGLAEDMVGYIFPEGSVVGIPSATNPNPSDTDRFGCGHSDDSESTGADAGNIVGAKLVKLLDAHNGPAERYVRGRFVLPGGKLSRDPLGGPEIKCNVDTQFHFSGPATGVELSSGQVIHPQTWMSLSGLPQRRPDRDTRGYSAPPVSASGWTCSRTPGSARPRFPGATRATARARLYSPADLSARSVKSRASAGFFASGTQPTQSQSKCPET